jgi:hypothetical protein
MISSKDGVPECPKLLIWFAEMETTMGAISRVSRWGLSRSQTRNAFVSREAYTDSVLFSQSRSRRNLQEGAGGVVM